jgi:hypothetical protein
MKPTIKNSGEPISPGELDDTEVLLGKKLPEEYRRFLLSHNGGQPVPATFRVSDGNETEAVGWLFALQVNEEGLVSIAQTYADYLPDDLLPVASDPFGNMICLAVSGSNLGRVYFWDHEGEAERSKSIEESRCRLVSKSFKEFLSSFVPQ